MLYQEKRRKWNKKYRELHRDEIRERNKKYREEHHDKAVESLRKYREKNPYYYKEYYKKHPEKARERCNRYRKKYPEKVRAWGRKYYKENIEKNRKLSREYSRKYPERVRESRRKYCKKNIEKIRMWRREYTKRLRSTPKGRIDHSMSTMILHELKSGKGGKKWESLVGYTVEQLKQHLQSKFTKGMTWAKFMAGEIHIDHVVPRSYFKYTTAEDSQFKECWSLHNLQPLWAKENIKKGNKIYDKRKEETDGKSA